MDTAQGKIAILRWESGQVPQGLLQLETMPGNSTNPASYPFPVRLVEVQGANADTVILQPSPVVLERMIALVQQLEREGIRAVTTSCGFNAVFQQALADAADIPVFTSSLLQVPFAQAIVGKHRSVGIITANRASLTATHLRACGITPEINYYLQGLEHCRQWRKIYEQPEEPFDLEAVNQEIIGAVEEAVAAHPDTGIILLECTDLPPYAQAIRDRFGLPVLDINSLIGYVALSLGILRLY